MEVWEATLTFKQNFSMLLKKKCRKLWNGNQADSENLNMNIPGKKPLIVFKNHKFPFN